MIVPSRAERDLALARFSRALFSQNVDSVYLTVTPDFVWRLPIGPDAPTAREIAGRDALAAYFAERNRLYANMRFNDLVWHHAPDAAFLTFTVTAQRLDGGPPVNAMGIERYTFRDGLVAQKDAYWKHIAVE
jgi:ketosteroid isomerase-like protein